MQAIILAAGMGRRLGEFTQHDTKAMLKVNGVRLIDRMLLHLKQLPLSRVVIVIGYEGKHLRDYVSEQYPDMRIEFVENKIFDKTNNIYSLWLAREYLSDEDSILLESDLIFDDTVLKKAFESPYQACALVSKYEAWMDGTMVRINDENDIVNFIPKKDFKYTDINTYYKTVNIYKFSRDFIVNHYLPFLEAYIKVLGENEYYEQVLRVMTLIDGSGIKALEISSKRWYEIDDIQDLRIAETIFADPESRLKKIQSSYGGYWRYPGILDFCYLVNPYFPTPRLVDEIKSNFDVLLRQYPSGMGVNSMLAGKYFGIRQDYIAVGNGAAELIKSVMENSIGRIGMIYPTFEEYPNRIQDDRIIKFFPDNRDFSYTAKDLMDFFGSSDITTLLIVNPDNPSGNLIPMDSILELLDWSSQKGIRLLIDESFIDFADNAENMTLLSNSMLTDFPNLCIVKSISKSYGVPGLRLGIIASSDTPLISGIKKDVSIWNINSFAEFYMQIYGKYENDYIHSCDKFRTERELFFKELSQINGIRVIPSQANYFLCELNDELSSHELTLKLLSDYNILIKDCSSKKGFNTGKDYIRIAIRDRNDNHRLCEALLKIYGSRHQEIIQ